MGEESYKVNMARDLQARPKGSEAGVYGKKTEEVGDEAGVDAVTRKVSGSTARKGPFKLRLRRRPIGEKAVAAD